MVAYKSPPVTTWRDLRQQKRPVCCEALPAAQHEVWSPFQGDPRCEACAALLVRQWMRRERPGAELATRCTGCGDVDPDDVPVKVPYTPKQGETGGTGLFGAF